MPQIKWTKEDVIAKFKEAITPVKTGLRSNVLQGLIDKAKLKGAQPPKPIEGEERVF